MIERIRASKYRGLLWIAIIGILYLMTLLHIPMVVKNLFLVTSSSICLYMLWKENSEIKWEVPVLILGLFARVAFACLDVYAGFELPIGGGDDGITFMHTAIEYCQGDFHRQYTRYPYVLYAIFQITGINQFAAQYANILCWGFGAVLLQKLCKRLKMNGILRLLVILVAAWLPTNIWITSILYRDTYVMLLLLMSYYFLICWMQERKYSSIAGSMVAVFLAVLLHGGSIVALIPIAVTILFYSYKDQSFVLNRKKIYTGIALITGGIIALFIPQVQQIIINKFSFLENGLIDGINAWLAMKYDYTADAGSNYLMHRYLSGYFDIIVMTVQKIYYHMFSPVPHMWRDMIDAIAFFGSSAPIYLIAMVLWIGSIFYKAFDSNRFLLFMETSVTIVIYAWGNVNGGTAIRHREKILGLMILLAVYSLNIILQKRKERKNCEKLSEN